MDKDYYNDPEWDRFEQNDQYTRIHNTTLFGFKALNNDLTCMGYKYDLGKTYTIDKSEVKLNERGFHFCRYPADVLRYYSNDNSIYAIIRANDMIIESTNQCVTNEITILKLISKDELLNKMPTKINRFCGVEEWYKNGLQHRDDDLPASIYVDGTKVWYNNGLIHRDGDLPAYIDIKYSRQEWYKNGKKHRDGDLPAIIHGDCQIWCKEGKFHRDGDLPAVIDDKLQAWWKNGKKHRDNDLPAFIDDQCQEWYINDKRHRDNDKPAIIDGSRKEWYRNGIRHRDNDLPAIIKRIDDYTYVAWYKNGILHRDNDQPAIIDGSSRQWYKNGIKYHETMIP